MTSRYISEKAIFQRYWIHSRELLSGSLSIIYHARADFLFIFSDKTNVLGQSIPREKLEVDFGIRPSDSAQIHRATSDKHHISPRDLRAGSGNSRVLLALRIFAVLAKVVVVCHRSAWVFPPRKRYFRCWVGEIFSGYKNGRVGKLKVLRFFYARCR